ncbi:unnamed protein product [Protopolystoma xenopodis]|uniref:DNA replication licensing factor MCM4 n=1 Tax=Protopolystoma xenopodis TaxID=117903 RepID=A0A448WWE9_9PLAT|nr:unnamed protein product [Protopolystoma xenopodis]
MGISTDTPMRPGRSARRNAANAEPSSRDIFLHDVNTAEPHTSDADEASTTASVGARRLDEASEAQSHVDLRSGLRTSEVEPGSPLSYSDMSSATGTTTHTRGDVLSSAIRPGVNDEAVTGALHSGPFVPATGGLMGTTDSGMSATAQTVIWGTDVNISQVMDRFKRFILTFIPDSLVDESPLCTGQSVDPARPLYLQRMEDLVASGQTHLDINCAHLQLARLDLYVQLITFPKEVIPACDAAAHALFVDRFREANPDRPIQIRPFNCGKSRTLRNLDPDDLDQLVTVRGLVIRLSALIPEMMRAEFSCSVCGSTTTVPCERGRIAEPSACVRCHAAHTNQLMHNRCIFVDKQMIKLQESPEDMPASQTPHTVCLFAHEDLVEKVQPGDRVIVTGIYRAIPLRISSKQRTLKAVYRTYVDVLHFK